MTPRIDAYCSQRSYWDHIEPIWRALPPERRGTLMVGARILHKYVEAQGYDVQLGGQRFAGLPLLIAGHHDMHEAHPARKLIYLSHGADQTYADHPYHPAYSGGKQRDRVNLFLVPNETSAEREHATYPDTPIEIVGCPRLDRFPDIPDTSTHEKLTVAFAWHWDAPIVPESRWAFPQWREHMTAIHRSGEFQVIGTGHPRQWGQFQAFYDRHGIEAIQDPNEVLERADVLCFDNTSLGIEAMACGLGVVGLNASYYRPDVEHGLRFWELAPLVSLWPDQADLLSTAIREASRPLARHTNVSMTWGIYPEWTRGNATRLAVDAILTFLDKEPGRAGLG